MELALSLGDASQSLSSFLTKAPLDLTPPPPTNSPCLDFCMALGVGRSSPTEVLRESGDPAKERSGDDGGDSSDSSYLLQLDLLPFSPVPRSCSSGGDSTAKCSSHFRLPWLVENLGCKLESSSLRGQHLDVNLFPVAIEDTDDVTAQSSSPNSAASSFPMDLGIAISGRGGRRSETEGDTERDCLRGSDEDENKNGSMSKKLRLSKEQSAFLEESFKEHSTLNPKQKIALAKQLSLRPRQVEVWFQNRRARTKLKQTEIDFDYWKRCCETLTEENRKLQKELQDLRALKTARPFYLHPPATTLTMCPSCKRSSVPATSPAAVTTATKPRMHPIGGSQPGQGQQQQHTTGPVGS